tara:strand:- start:2011 stop:3489 length:1479 start_codon:yes stop_codon:yes gene_type:complete
MGLPEVLQQFHNSLTQITYDPGEEVYDDPRKFELKKLEMEMVSGDKLDIGQLVVDFEYHESIESSFLRCDFSIFDAVDFNKNLLGGEYIDVELVTAAALKEEHLKFRMQVFKIGSIIKSERGQMYILHCVSPEMYIDEMNKVFKGFGPGDGAVDEDCIPKYICENYLKAKGGDKIKKKNFENHSKYTFLACSWKPSDAIHFLSDKVTRLNSSKGDSKQSGFLFWENRNGFQFRSIDSICEGHAHRENVYTYNYIQKSQEGVGNLGRYSIESIKYPDKANHLSNMRMGTYKTAAIGISFAAARNSFAPVSGKKEDTEVDTVTASGGSGLSPAPGGTVNEARVLTFGQIFNKANTLEERPPYKVPDFFDVKKTQPTRMKIRALPGLKNQTSTANPNNGTNPDIDTMAVAQYAAARYNLLKSIQLIVEVPGNSALTAGNLINIIIPASIEEGENLKVDQRFSGKYIIAGLTHIYKREGLTSRLYLVRDSVPKTED